MTEILYNYLRERFYKNNHDKYHKYFKKWVANLTDSQLYYFEIERNNILTKSKYQR